MLTDQCFVSVFKGAAATVGGMVDRKRQPVTPPAARPAGRAHSSFVAASCMYYTQPPGTRVTKLKAHIARAPPPRHLIKKKVEDLLIDAGKVKPIGCAFQRGGDL